MPLARSSRPHICGMGHAPRRELGQVTRGPSVRARGVLKLYRDLSNTKPQRPERAPPARSELKTGEPERGGGPDDCTGYPTLRLHNRKGATALHGTSYVAPFCSGCRL